VKAEVVYLYAFDVAAEIATDRIQSILSERPLPFEIRTDRTYPRDVPLYRPLAVKPSLKETVNGYPVQSLVRVYDVGAITVMLRVALTINDLQDLYPFHDPRTSDGKAAAETARHLCAQVREGLSGLLVAPTVTSEPEAYTIFCLTELNTSDVNQWFEHNQRAVAGLLTETAPHRLSHAQVLEVCRLFRSFETTDLVVVDWDAALVVDLDGYVEDVLYVFELANLQLEEFRVMDRALDDYLNRAYDDLEHRRFSWWGVSSPVLKVLRQYRVDVTKLADQVTHITKFIGDWHLARVYLAARERFHIDQWRGSVESRLSLLDQLYGVVQSEVYEQRMLWLELIIVILFVIDLLGIFFWKS